VLEATVQAFGINKYSLNEQTGRPLGSASFVEGLENTSGRFLKPKKLGRKLKDTNK
jgi:hypothetical protein